MTLRILMILPRQTAERLYGCYLYGARGASASPTIDGNHQSSSAFSLHVRFHVGPWEPWDRPRGDSRPRPFCYRNAE